MTMKKSIFTICLAAALLSAGQNNTLYAAPDNPSSTVTEREMDEDGEKAITALAKMLYGEARGVKSMTEQAACVWVVLNRVDDERWPDDVVDVLSQPYQFGGYREYFPAEEWALDLAADVYDRWTDERETGQDAGRVIPDDYFFWRGSRDGHNYFRKEFGDYSRETYTFELESPYDD